MTGLDSSQIAIFRLLLRSKVGENGWYRVSEAVWPSVEGSLPPDLVEERPADGGEGGFIRLTARGQAIADYL